MTAQAFQSLLGWFIHHWCFLTQFVPHMNNAYVNERQTTELPSPLPTQSVGEANKNNAVFCFCESPVLTKILAVVNVLALNVTHTHCICQCSNSIQATELCRHQCIFHMRKCCVICFIFETTKIAQNVAWNWLKFHMHVPLLQGLRHQSKSGGAHCWTPI